LTRVYRAERLSLGRPPESYLWLITTDLGRIVFVRKGNSFRGLKGRPTPGGETNQLGKELLGARKGKERKKSFSVGGRKNEPSLSGKGGPSQGRRIAYVPVKVNVKRGEILRRPKKKGLSFPENLKYSYVQREKRGLESKKEEEGKTSLFWRCGQRGRSSSTREKGRL